MQKTKTIPRFNGIQTIHRFDNGYGASVIEHSFSHGREMAVVKFTGDTLDDFDLCYDSGITQDVLGHLSPADVEHYLVRIEKLPSLVPLS
jgi:hypothetical protein